MVLPAWASAGRTARRAAKSMLAMWLGLGLGLGVGECVVCCVVMNRVVGWIDRSRSDVLLFIPFPPAHLFLSGRKNLMIHPHEQKNGVGWVRTHCLALLPLEMSIPAHIFLSHF